MKPCSESHELRTVTHQNGFAALAIGAPALTSLDKYIVILITLRHKSIYHGVRKTMKKNVILEIFGYLRDKGIVSGESEFSEFWLGHSEGYMRKLRSTQSEPSMGAVAICASRLQQASEFIRQSPAHAHVADRFLALSQQCQQIVNEGAAELELV